MHLMVHIQAIREMNLWNSLQKWCEADSWVIIILGAKKGSLILQGQK